MSRPRERALLVGCLAIMAQTPTPGDYFSCTAGATGIGTSTLNITIVVNGSSVSSSQPLTITVAALNNTGTPVKWSPLSGTCALSAAVRLGEAWLPITPARTTCASIGPPPLDPTLSSGEQRSETFLWVGEVRRSGQAQRLAPGSYELRGEAGSLGTSVSTRVTVLPL